MTDLPKEPPSKGIMLVGYGGPRSSQEIRPFLDDVLRDRPIPRERYEEVLKQYERLSGASPIHDAVSRLADSLRKVFRAERLDLPVYVGMRHGTPSLKETLLQMGKDGVRDAVAVVLSSFRSEPSWDRYVAGLESARQSIGESAPQLSFLEPWYENPLFIQAMTDRILEAQAVLPLPRQKTALWIFSAHSIPLAADEISGYSKQLSRCAELCAQRLDREAIGWRLVYQSRSGRGQEPWLTPDVVQVMGSLKGMKDVIVIPLGFLVDNAEILYDLDVRAREAAEAVGVRVLRTKTVGDHPGFLEIILRGIRKAADGH